MSTATTSAPVSIASTAAMNAWINEICTALVTTCGITQSTDTGQVWSAAGGATGTLPGAANTSAGYVILEFNDTLQATCPVFIKLEFGTGSSTSAPSIWITIGTGSNGSGTLTGTTTTRVQTSNNTAPLSTTANYTSLYTYNSTYGTCGVAFKQGAESSAVPYGTLGGFYVFRGTASNGGANSDAVCLLSNGSSNANGSSGSAIFMQCYSYGNATVYPPSFATNGSVWAFPAFRTAATAQGGTIQVWPVFYSSPLISISGVCGVVQAADIGYNSTFSTTLIGGTAITMINAGGILGSNYLSGGISIWDTAGEAGVSVGNAGLAILWE